LKLKEIKLSKDLLQRIMLNLSKDLKIIGESNQNNALWNGRSALSMLCLCTHSAESSLRFGLGTQVEAVD